MRFVRYI